MVSLICRIPKSQNSQTQKADGGYMYVYVCVCVCVSKRKSGQKYKLADTR